MAPKKITQKIEALKFLIRNVNRLRRISEIKSTTKDAIIYRAYQSSDASDISRIYSQLMNAPSMGSAMTWHCTLLGSRCLLVAVDSGAVTEQIVGFNMYYINERDVDENTIHEGFIGVVLGKQGLGIATSMRKIAHAHFANFGFAGVSTRISTGNIASLQSAKAVGFVPLETYLDGATTEERQYLRCEL